VGVAAQAVDAVSIVAWPSRGFPKPPERSISDRRSFASCSPITATSRRLPGESVLVISFFMKI
jgi:hypothetical protein